MATPIETPTPTVPLAPMAAEAAMTLASILDVLLDRMFTLPVEVTVLFPM